MGLENSGKKGPLERAKRILHAAAAISTLGGTAQAEPANQEAVDAARNRTIESMQKPGQTEKGQEETDVGRRIQQAFEGGEVTVEVPRNLSNGLDEGLRTNDTKGDQQVAPLEAQFHQHERGVELPNGSSPDNLR